MGSDNTTASPDRSRGPWFEGRAETPSADDLADRYRDALLRIGAVPFREAFHAEIRRLLTPDLVRHYHYDAEYHAQLHRLAAVNVLARKSEEVPGCDDNGVPSPEVTDWVLDVYARSVDILTALFVERGAPEDFADRLARACLARLAHADPPITVELLGK